VDQIELAKQRFRRSVSFEGAAVAAVLAQIRMI
jgi:hypothetical protein